MGDVHVPGTFRPDPSAPKGVEVPAVQVAEAPGTFVHYLGTFVLGFFLGWFFL